MSREAVAEQVRTLREGAGVVLLDRDVVQADGEEAASYLQGQLSQDVEALAPGRSTYSFVLAPHGKVEVWCRVTRLPDGSFLLDTDAGWGEALLARLERFRLRSQISFRLLEWSVAAVRGAGAPPPAPPADERLGVVVPVEWPGNRGWDLLARSVQLSEVGEALTLCTPEAMEVLRIEAGVPRMGAELDAGTIPAECGMVPVSVSFTKGCYTGQELVARIASRGSRVPRRLVGLVAGGGQAFDAGAALLHEGREVGRVTSVALADRCVALAYLARAVDVPAELSVDGVLPVSARALPIAADRWV